MIPRITLILFISLQINIEALHAQRAILTSDVPYFQEKAKTYQRWLDTTGVGQVLRVDKVSVPGNDPTTLQLHLLLKTTDPDSAVAFWSRVRSSSEDLFDTFISFMDIPDQQGELHIYLKDDEDDYQKCFWIILSRNDSKSIDVSGQFEPCKTKSQPINITIRSVNTENSRVKTQKIILKPTKEQVFNELIQLIRDSFPWNKYVNKDCSGRYPEIRTKIENDECIISIEELCQEVLFNSQLSYWCKTARYWNSQSNCNDMRREMVLFKVKYIPLDKNSFQLTGEIRGKFGSGKYRPRSLDTGWWEMDPDFRIAEEVFAKKYLALLEKRLVNKYSKK